MDQSTTLSIVLKLVDEATGAMSSVTSKLEANKESIIGVGVAAGAAFAAITVFAKGAVDAATEQQNAQAQLAAVIKSTGNEAGVTLESMNALSEALSKSTGYTDNEITSIETMLIGMKSLAADKIPAATQAILDFAARTGNDAVSSAQLLGKALGEPAIAAGALTRAHIILSDAQKKSIADFVAAGDKASAQGVILDALSGVVGGAAEQTNTLAFQQRELNAQVDQANEAIGNALIPILTSLLQKVLPVIEAVTKWATAHPKLTAAIIIGIAAITGLTAVVSALALAMLALSTVSLPIVAIMVGIAVVIGLLIYAGINLYNQWGNLKIAAGEIAASMTKVWTTFATFMKGVWDGMVADVKGSVDTIIDIMNALIAAVDKIHIHVPSVNIGGVKLGGYDIGFNIPQIPKLAQGGIVDGPTLALIGEAGPEAVVPLGRGGGLGSTVNVYVQGGYYLDQMAARDMGNLIAKAVGQQLKLRTV